MGKIFSYIGFFFKKQKMFIIAGAFVASFWGGWQVHDWKVGSEESAVLKVQIENQRMLDRALSQISRDTLEQIENIKVENKTIYNETKTEILREPVYSECIIPTEGIDLINKSRGYK